MSLSDFNSFLEIMAIFNFAYVASDSFTADVNAKIVRSFKNVEEQIISISSKLEGVKQSLYNIKIYHRNGINTEQGVQSAQSLFATYEGKWEKLTDETKKTIAGLSVSGNMSYICFYFALFSLLLLILSGIYSGANGEINSATFYEFVLLLDAVSVIFLIYCFIKSKGIKVKSSLEGWKLFRVWGLRNIPHLRFFRDSEVGYIGSLKWLGLSLLIPNLYFSVWALENGKDCPVNLETFTVLFTVFLPAAHFLFYFGVAIINSVIFGPRLEKRLAKYEDELNAFNAAHVTRLITLHEDIKIYEVERASLPSLMIPIPKNHRRKWQNNDHFTV